MEDFILLVEDSFIDVEIIKRAFKKADITNPIHHCENAQIALNFLEGLDKHKLPMLIFMDLNMPGIGGLDALVKLKANQHTKEIPAIVLTTSNNQKDIDESYKNGANCFLQKPSQPDQYVELAKDIKSFWLRWVKYPVVA